MPYTVNGVGTTYYGKKNTDEHIGVCQSCNQRGVLLDYDTRHWFVIFFLPIIPLGRKRILNYCSLCSRHQVIKLHEWEEGTQAAMKEGMEALRNNPESQEAMVQAHATFAQTGKREEALKLATHMREKFPDDVDLHLYLAGWYESVGKNEEVDACLEHAYELDPENPFASHGMALVYLDRKQPDKARDLLEKYKPGSEYYDPAAFIQLADSYQSMGAHESAAEIHEMILKANPETGMSKEFRKSVKKTSQALGTPTPEMDTPPIYKHPAVLTAAAAIFVLVAFTMWTIYMSNNRTIYAVNGMSVPITFKIDDGTPIEVPALSQIETSIAEGEHQVELISPEVAVTPADTVSIQGGFFSRIFDKSITVLDPSESAVLQKMHNFYADDPEHKNIDLPPSVFHVCKPVSVFPEIDYPFEPFPDEIKISDSDSVVFKTGLNFLPVDEDRFELLFLILPDLKQQYEYCKRHIKLFGPDDELIELLVTSSQSPKQLQESKIILQQLLEEDITKVSYHSLFMAVSSRLEEDKELIEYYEKLIADHPADAEFHYLRGLLYTKISETQKHWEKTLEIDANYVEVQLALASLAYTQHDYDQAISILNNVNDSGTTDQLDSALTMRLRCLHQLNQDDEITKLTIEKKQEHWRFLIKHLITNGNPQKAKEFIKQRVQQIEQESPGGGSIFEQIAKFALAYDQKQYSLALIELEKSVFVRSASITQLELQLLNRRYGKAMNTYQALPVESRRFCNFLFSMAYLADNNQTEAEEWLKRGLDEIRSGNQTERYCVELFEKDNLSWDELSDLNLQGSSRKMIFALFALKHDQLRESITNYLNENNIDIGGGELIVDKVLSSDLDL